MPFTLEVSALHFNTWRSDHAEEVSAHFILLDVGTRQELTITLAPANVQ